VFPLLLRTGCVAAYSKESLAWSRKTCFVHAAQNWPPKGREGRFCVFDSLLISERVPRAVPRRGLPQAHEGLEGRISSYRSFTPVGVLTKTLRLEPDLFAPCTITEANQTGFLKLTGISELVSI